MLEPRYERKDVENQPGVLTHENDNAEPMSETGSEFGVKQVVEKQEVVSLIPEEPSCGVHKEDRNGSEVIVHEDCDTPPAQEIELESMDSGCGHDTADQDNLEELMKNHEAIKEQHPDNISICSLD